jgi:hypothetical protein
MALQYFKIKNTHWDGYFLLLQFLCLQIIFFETQIDIEFKYSLYENLFFVIFFRFFQMKHVIFPNT